MNIEDTINDISTNLAIIISQVKLKNRANLNDINTLLETVFKNILNIIYDGNFVNLNNEYLYPAIDLGDKKAGIAFQVTSEKGIRKIKETLKKFEENNLDKEYTKLKFLIIDEKPKYSSSHNIDTKYFVLKDDIISCYDLVNIIKDLNIEKQTLINSKLKSTIGIRDNISLDTIFENRKNVKRIENEYTEKISITNDMITSAVLPVELQKYFEVKPQIVDNKFKYTLNPLVDNAYDLHPIKEKLKMKFPSIQEKEQFIKDGGINGLIRKATITRKLVEIPYIAELSGYIGKYKNPFSETNYHNADEVKLYVFPHKLPKGEKYKIIISDGREEFKINKTVLQIVDAQKKQIILNNFESKEEDFDIILKLTIVDNNDEEERECIKYIPYIEINLREKNKYICSKKLEFEKFLFTINSCKSTVKILKYKGRSATEFMNIEKLGKKKYTEEDYKSFNRFKKLIKKIIYIEDSFKMNIKYDVKYFYKNEIAINLIYCDLKKQNYKFPIPLKVEVYTDDYNKHKYKDFITDWKSDIKLFEKDFQLTNTKIYLKNCKLFKNEIRDGIRVSILVSETANYIPKWNIQ